MQSADLKEEAADFSPRATLNRRRLWLPETGATRNGSLLANLKKA